jgi:quercetin dioxygenase-like cupin family protein
MIPLMALCSCGNQPRGEGHVYPAEIKVTHLLQAEVDAAGHKLEYPKSGNAELTAVLVEIPAGAKTGWHIHTVPCAAYMIEGEVQIELADGSMRTVKQGQTFAEVVNLLHNGRNPGPKTAKLVLFVAGRKDMAYTVKKNAPAR